MKLFNFKKPLDLTGYTLIMPSVSVGNVPQLMTDLLITTLKLENVATLWHPGLIASVGTDPFYSDENTICTACELYANSSLKLAAIQLRSTIEPKLLLKFLADFIEAVVEFKLKRFYILATGFDYELHNIANKNLFHFVTNNNEIKESIKETVSSKELGRDYNGKIVVPGSGFATKLYDKLGNNVETILLVKYVSEGENIHDAKYFLTVLLKFLKASPEEATALPTSWNYVYGAPPPLGMF